jgi:hypothetical protein
MTETMLQKHVACRWRCPISSYVRVIFDAFVPENHDAGQGVRLNKRHQSPTEFLAMTQRNFWR